MLKVITLWTIQKIFEDAKIKIPASSQMLYINCIMHHFDKKPPRIEFTQAFEIPYNAFPKFNSFKNQLDILQQAGLIKYSGDAVMFINLWTKYIDTNRLTEIQTESYSGDMPYHSIVQYEQRLKSDTQRKELQAKKHSTTTSKIDEYIETFISEQKLVMKTYDSYNACVSHFHHWLPKNINKTNPSRPSSGKILGMDNG